MRRGLVLLQVAHSSALHALLLQHSEWARSATRSKCNSSSKQRLRKCGCSLGRRRRQRPPGAVQPLQHFKHGTRAGFLPDRYGSTRANMCAAHLCNHGVLDTACWCVSPTRLTQCRKVDGCGGYSINIMAQADSLKVGASPGHPSGPPFGPAAGTNISLLASTAGQWRVEPGARMTRGQHPCPALVQYCWQKAAGQQIQMRWSAFGRLLPPWQGTGASERRHD